MTELSKKIGPFCLVNLKKVLDQGEIRTHELLLFRRER